LEDIVQNTLIKAVRNLHSYRGEAALFTWLTQICRHELADVNRKAARRPAHVSLDEPTTASIVAQLRIPERREPIAEMDAAVQRTEVMQVLGSLPEDYARALEAKYGDGLSVDEIARQLGLTVIATQSLLARARETFRERWQARSKSPVSGASPP
jgi:RNA polymerase sigma-70 factor (ECF subfamily)